LTDIEFRSHMTVELIEFNATDEMVVRAARVSTQMDRNYPNNEQKSGLINYLMKNRHGTPFEHNFFQFRIECPIAISREFMRHRVGWSYNEESGRYSELKPVFWVPNEDRNLVQTGKPGHYEMSPGSADQEHVATISIKNASFISYENYVSMLNAGISREVARMCLPVNIYTSFYATCNARSLMHFLSLRTDHENAMFTSKPQQEIQDVAIQMEVYLSELMPETYRAFVAAGYVAP
jgi:thymidylate synthase (FAD)